MTAPQILLLCCRHRWSMPVLAELHRTGGGTRFVVLINRLGMSRDSLARTLASQIESGLVLRNPGYGHPLRPECILAPRGALLAPSCARLLALLRRLKVEDTALRRWPLGITATIAAGRRRFSEIRSALPSITTRALAIGLRDLQGAHLIERTVWDDSPPLIEYRLSPRGAQVAPILVSLAEAGASESVTPPVRASRRT
jgi:DNA-binding HxlR family transcriptional regulator